MFSGMHKVTGTNTNTPISRHRRLPSLSALRAFEAAARHSSFRMAADELNVTHSAISHQVKALEDHLSVPLFSRGGRAVHLTEEGRILFPILRMIGLFPFAAAVDEAQLRQALRDEGFDIEVTRVFGDHSQNPYIVARRSAGQA